MRQILLLIKALQGTLHLLPEPAGQAQLQSECGHGFGQGRDIGKLLAVDLMHLF